MLEGFNRDEENQRAKLEEESLDMSQVHFSQLHDLNEDMSGEKIDLTTGNPIDNSHDDPGTFEVEEVIDHGGITEDLLPPIIEEEDEAEKWLRENDEEYKSSDAVIFKNKKK